MDAPVPLLWLGALLSVTVLPSHPPPPGSPGRSRNLCHPHSSRFTSEHDPTAATRPGAPSLPPCLPLSSSKFVVLPIFIFHSAACLRRLPAARSLDTTPLPPAPPCSPQNMLSLVTVSRLFCYKQPPVPWLFVFVLGLF